MGPEYLLIFLTAFKMSGWFISLPWFLSLPNKGLKTTDNYSSVTAQEDRSFMKQTGDSTLPRCESRWPWRSHQDSSWLHFLYLLSTPLGSALCKIGLVSTTNQERKSKWAYTQGWFTVASYITTDYFTCLPIIQSVIMRCMFSRNICEQLKSSGHQRLP